VLCANQPYVEIGGACRSSLQGNHRDDADHIFCFSQSRKIFSYLERSFYALCDAASRFEEMMTLAWCWRFHTYLWFSFVYFGRISVGNWCHKSQKALRSEVFVNYPWYNKSSVLSSRKSLTVVEAEDIVESISKDNKNVVQEFGKAPTRNMCCLREWAGRPGWSSKDFRNRQPTIWH